MNTFVIHSGRIRKKSEVTSRSRGEEGWVFSCMGHASPLTLRSSVCQPRRSSRTPQSALAPQYFSTLDNGIRISSQSVLSNCFLSLLVCVHSAVMNGYRNLGCCLALLLDQNANGWPKAGRRTNLAASKAVCGEIGGYYYWALFF